ncbi:MAG: CDP-diacylglycerol--serine O-phosphatidyltransferase [Bacteroidetes bacterium]|nr:CDP-diacylglycerol--serine O-phosphatidyltransferase [Bacteroidota bacterium]MCY4233363.1 CDP-diacylglycerol--serine O-phosphatidyltransferase [Bacteroidota bacterium]
MRNQRKTNQAISRSQLTERETTQSTVDRARVAVPSFFTLMNLFCGFVAITQIHQGQYVPACYLILLAGLFDLLDGMVARLTNGASLFGTELDSLCDVVSFGVAPAYLIYSQLLQSSGMFGLIVSALPVMCSAVRLARFNLQYSPEKKPDFEGLPTPVNAFCIVAIVLNIIQDTWIMRAGGVSTEFLIPIIVVLSLLMISMIRFDGVPRISLLYLRSNPGFSTAYIIAVMVMCIFPYTGLLLVLLVYVSVGLIRTISDSVRMLMALPK